MNFLAQIIYWLNIPANIAGEFLTAPVSAMPGWFSNMVISGLAGIGLLVLFKYTSNQTAIGRIRDKVNANMLVMKLFKDSMAVTLQAQGRLFRGAFLLLFHAVRPMLVMVVPVCLLLGQLGMWYQFRPLSVGEEAVVSMTLNSKAESPWPQVKIASMPSAEVITGPVKVFSKREIYWKIKASREGYHKIVFQVDDRTVEKTLATGNGFMRVSPKRPGNEWTDILLYPQEKPFEKDSSVYSISIEFPVRQSKTSGTDWWIVYFFVVSMIFALMFKPLFKVRI